MLNFFKKCNYGTLIESIIVNQKTINMKTSNNNRKVTFDKMLALLNRGVDTYIEEFGRKSFKNPSFVFVDRKQAA